MKIRDACAHLRVPLIATVGCAVVGLVTLRASHGVETPYAGAWQRKVHPQLLAETATGRTASFIVLLADQPDVSAAYGIADPDARGWYVYRTLRAHAARSQVRLRRWLRDRGAHYRSFWAANMLVVTGDQRLLEELAARGDTAVIESNAPRRWIEEPVSAADTTGPQTVEWGVSSINAPAVWAMGYTGQGIVIGNEDTGMQWDHPALKPHYRGWNGSVADHNYNWHDAIHDSTGNPCGNDAPAPCDDNGHGTHTTGSTSGDDGSGNQIGVAPGAQWIGCRNMDRGNGTPTRYTECFQFFIAPTDANGNNPDPSKRPHVINNSWICPPSEGCAANTLQTIVNNVQAAGIFVVASAGNSGSSCGTVSDPPAIYASSFTVGAHDVTSTLATFSSRGPVTVDSSNRLKPEIVAPGVDVRSSYPTNAYAILSGTSMAGPHVVGAVALLWSARPQLVRDIATTTAILESSANPSVAAGGQICGGVSSTTVPNYSFGYGRVDVLAAVNSVPANTATVTPTPTNTAVPPTPTATPTVTVTPTLTATASPTATVTPSATATATPSVTVSSTPTATPAPAADLGTAVGRPGGLACVGATLTTGGAQVAATSNAIGFDASQFSFLSCTINPAIGTGSAANKQLTLNGSAGNENVQVGGTTTALSSAALYLCQWRIAAGTAVGTYALTNAAAATDPLADPVPGFTGAPGRIVVSTCTGDCDGNGVVTIGEVVKCVNLFLGAAACNAATPDQSCPIADADSNGNVSIGEVVQCVNRFLGGC